MWHPSPPYRGWSTHVTILDGRVINIVDSTLTVKDINTGEELTFFYPNEQKVLH